MADTVPPPPDNDPEVVAASSSTLLSNYTSFFTSLFSNVTSFRWTKTSPPEGDAAQEAILGTLQTAHTVKKVDIGDGQYMNTVEFECNGPVKQTLVVCHGFGAGLGFFHQNFDALAQKPGLKVIALDWLGMGLSSRPPFPYNGTVKEAEDFFLGAFERWRDSMGLTNFTLMGHSLGGYLSTLYTMRHPEVVNKLLLVSPAGVGRKPEGAHPVTPAGTYLRSMLFKTVEIFWNWNVTPQSVTRAAGPWGRHIMGGYVDRRFKHLEEMQAKNLREYLYHISALPPSGEYALNTILSFGAWAREPLCDRIEGLKVPTVFYYGAHDWMDKRFAYEVQSKINAPSKVVVVEHAGHHLYLDNPDEFNAVVLAELEKGKDEN
eukprot:Colp12_sorted_trinity150504_noHs@19534